MANRRWICDILHIHPCDQKERNRWMNHCRMLSVEAVSRSVKNFSSTGVRTTMTHLDIVYLGSEVSPWVCADDTNGANSKDSTALAYVRKACGFASFCYTRII